MKEQFLDRMKRYLGDEYEAYEQTLQEGMYRGLRINPCKSDIEEIKALSLCEMTPSKICSDSFYIPEDVAHLGNHPAHLAGLFYMQEPSASSAVEVLDVQAGDWVLDLCAAPGGKSTQIGAKLHHTGFLVSNEIDAKRAVILMSNMERMGFGECMITNTRPEILCEEMMGCFDKVLVDAPCSGEGMFKKHSKAMDDWSEEHVCACATRQQLILDSAYEALKQDGIMVYSTCTYSMEENEETVYAFLEKHPDMELIDAGVNFGRVGFPYKNLDHTLVRRILPMDQGEGHFIAKMKKHGPQQSVKLKKLTNDGLPSFVNDFLSNQLNEALPYHIVLYDKVYLKNTPFIKLKKTRILRQGILAGEIIKNRIEPHQHFYTASLLQNRYQHIYDMSEDECHAFLEGNQLSVSGYKGFIALSWHHHPIGFGKGDGMVIKNKYPKGMRIR